MLVVLWGKQLCSALKSAEVSTKNARFALWNEYLGHEEYVQPWTSEARRDSNQKHP